MSKREPKLYIENIFHSIQKIEDYTKNMLFVDFEEDEKTMDAVVRNLEIIGEAAKYISQDFGNEFSKIPWKEMISMRNKVSHEYFGVDSEILWETITNDLPVLKEKLKKLV